MKITSYHKGVDIPADDSGDHDYPTFGIDVMVTVDNQSPEIWYNQIEVHGSSELRDAIIMQMNRL